MQNWLLLGGFLLSGLLGLIILPNILFVSHKKHLFDMPDARKVHTAPVPRLGGLAFLPVILVTVFLIMGIYLFVTDFQNTPSLVRFFQMLMFLFAGMTLLYLVGEADDLVGVGYRYKFLVQTVAAALIVLSGNWLGSFAGLFGIENVPAWIGMPVTILAIIFITNAINLIDGIDGLASGLSIISLLTLTVLLLMNSSFSYTLFAVATLGIVLVFWFYNVFGNAMKGHKLFMGDTGSLTLGYILSFLTIHLSQDISGEHGKWQMIVAFSSLLVPMFDVVRVSLHRIRKGRSPFLPDKNHIHHKLIRAGMKKTGHVLVTILGIDLFFIVFNALLAGRLNITLLLFCDIAIYTSLQFIINRFIRKNNGGPSYVPVEELAESEPELAKELGLDKDRRTISE